MTSAAAIVLTLMRPVFTGRQRMRYLLGVRQDAIGHQRAHRVHLKALKGCHGQHQEQLQELLLLIDMRETMLHLLEERQGLCLTRLFEIIHQVSHGGRELLNNVVYGDHTDTTRTAALWINRVSQPD